MQLSPLQSRLAASLIASCLLLVVYLFFFFPQFATATQLDDHVNDGWLESDVALGAMNVEDPEYGPEFALFDRSVIGRAPPGVTGLANNVPLPAIIEPGDTLNYAFEISTIEDAEASDPSRLRELRSEPNGSPAASGDEGGLKEGNSELVRRQQRSRTLWISANTCRQPSRISPDRTAGDPPQLTLFVSKSSENTSPGPDQDDVELIPFREGAVMFNTSFTEDVFFSIHAPEVSDEVFDTSLPYDFEVAASIDQSYHTVANASDSQLIWVDSDARGALLTTRNLTSRPEQVVETPPYVLFAHNKADPGINGLRNSYCGLGNVAQFRPLEDGSNGHITTGLKQGGRENLTRQEFYIGGLNASSEYVGILVHDPDGTALRPRRNVPGGGGVVHQPIEMETKPLGACRVIFNLTLCDETQYAVPANWDLFPEMTDLAAFYDDYTQTMYSNFKKSLQQIQCETQPENRYSLVRNCTDCEKAYKDWLCSVAIPRCEDFSEPDRAHLQARNINEPFPNGTMVDERIREEHGNETAWTSSRNPLIDKEIRPGPYKEVLPCDDVCYQLVQSCPAALGFQCPLPGMIGFNTTYGRRSRGDGGVACNYPGSAHYPPAAGAQTLEQRKRNAKFAKEQELRRGKSEAEIKKRVKDAPKSPISPFWLGIFAFIVFGGLVFEIIARVFFR
ncbi:hypothetical protein DL762_004276 [Monosporascus cannonballus]|uniref:FZ domain-containing protein n=1 Tax=Monosporascus cannonballus TaxID=155416 RepID=A0ABY0HB59_9PEZI|nr:hypothetical protein DL762_004276 [Monosporascus cannonballus]